ncbi:DUF6082 family protein [Streptomyces sp. OfavH-34-F]|uniref:DUF6082 family protein n=1 Tax=Streptomyces sp. OfavH-34-F TaxID=2917760 RepID=UPI001EF2E8CC|nr:DUF6082 family protein [Streptomyces sp. OfavH-34-F]MCG7523837.1 DUF6082 family protein [Streptomyces sp. OfavH-34-F]
MTKTTPRLALLALTVLAGAHLVQKERHQRQIISARFEDRQERWLTLMMTRPDIAEVWAPEGMTGEQYAELMGANSLLCSLAARYRHGLDSKQQMRHCAFELMQMAPVRRYWEHFAARRQAEAVRGHRRLTAVNEALADAYSAFAVRLPLGEEEPAAA